MKALKVAFILTLAVAVVGVCAFEFYKHMDLKPQVELVKNKDWSLTTQQQKEFEKINQAFSSSLKFKNFVTEFSSVFKALSNLSFIEDARWAWDHNQPLKIKAIVSRPKAMMFKNNDWFLVNEKGTVLKKVGIDQTLDLPIFMSEQLLKNENLREKSFKILMAFDDSTSIPLSAVSEISIDPRGISFLLSEGYKVYMSDKNPATQIERVSNVISYLKREKINAEFIDSQSIQKILVRPKTKKD